MVLLPDGRAKIRAKARAEMHSIWAAWNERRLDSESRGESFDEPPPAPPDGYRDGKGDDSGGE